MRGRFTATQEAEYSDVDVGQATRNEVHACVVLLAFKSARYLGWHSHMDAADTKTYLPPSTRIHTPPPRRSQTENNTARTHRM